MYRGAIPSLLALLTCLATSWPLLLPRHHTHISFRFFLFNSDGHPICDFCAVRPLEQVEITSTDHAQGERFFVDRKSITEIASEEGEGGGKGRGEAGHGSPRRGLGAAEEVS